MDFWTAFAIIGVTFFVCATVINVVKIKYGNDMSFKDMWK